jgi:hypothetical protein
MYNMKLTNTHISLFVALVVLVVVIIYLNHGSKESFKGAHHMGGGAHHMGGGAHHMGGGAHHMGGGAHKKHHSPSHKIHHAGSGRHHRGSHHLRHNRYGDYDYNDDYDYDYFDDEVPVETTLPVIVQQIPTPTSPTPIAPTVSNNEDVKTITLYLLPSLAVVAIIFMMLR